MQAEVKRLLQGEVSRLLVNLRSPNLCVCFANCTTSPAQQEQALACAAFTKPKVLLMAQGILAEDREEQKYPKWLRYLGIMYVAVFFWTLFSLPPTGYDFDSMILVLLLWMPFPFGLLYISEKPALVGEHKRAMRILITIFVFIAIFLGLVLSYAFME